MFPKIVHKLHECAFSIPGEVIFFYTVCKMIQRLCYSCCTWCLFSQFYRPTSRHSPIYALTSFRVDSLAGRKLIIRSGHTCTAPSNRPIVQLLLALLKKWDIKMAVLVCRNKITKEPLCLYHCILVYMQILW